MGGNALKKFDVQTVRLPALEYRVLTKEVIAKFRRARYTMHEIEAYRTKESFGDLDLVYTGTKLNSSDIRSLFPDTKAIYPNGDVISFEYKDFQVDLIHSEADCLDYALGYFGQNDICGNLAGKLFHKFGLKHGHDGLWLPVRDGDNMFASIRLTTDFARALMFVDLEPCTDFETLEEGFRWVSKSVYFDPESYKLENLNTIARVRDKKRTTHNKFLDWCQNWTDSGNVPKTQFIKNKLHYIPQILSNFPGAKEEYTRVVRNLGFQKHIKTKFNGVLVSELTGLKDKELGMLMRYLKNLDEFDPNIICLSSEETIRENILRYAENCSTVL